MDLSPTRSSFGKHGLRTIMLKKLRQKLADGQFGGLLVACRQRQAGNLSHLSSPSVEEAGSLPPNWTRGISCQNVQSRVHVVLLCYSITRRNARIASDSSASATH